MDTIISQFRAWAVAAAVILIWGMTFANIRALLATSRRLRF